jgi:hypothetical protein
MDREWILLSKETKRRFSGATWVPLRASQSTSNGLDVRQIGYIGEVLALGSVAIPPEHKEIGDRLKWTDIGIGHSVLPHVYEDGYYSPIDQYQYNDKQPIGVELIFEHPQPVVGGKKWIINPDLIVALRLVKEENAWVRPEEDFAVVIREVFDADGNHAAIEIKKEFLLDYLAARGLSLRLSYYRQRVANVSALKGSAYDGLKEESIERDDGRFHLLIRSIEEIWGGTWATLRVWRTDIDEDADAPVMGPENDHNVESESSEGRRAGPQGVRVEGEYWREEWIEHLGLSTRVRGDDDPTILEFIAETDGTRMTSTQLDDEDIGRWLWFRPEAVKAFLAHRGFRLEWYTAETGGLHSTSGYRTHFGLNSSDYVTVFAYDVARLPTWEQRIWAAYNVGPEGGVSKELLAAQVRAAPANTKAPEERLSELMKAVGAVFSDRFGSPLYLHELDTTGIPLSRFDGVDDVSLLRLAKELHRNFGDRLNVPVLRQISTHQSKLGSIKSLESILASISTPELAHRVLAKIVGVYDLRVGDAHPTSSAIEEAFLLAGIDRSRSPLRQAEQMIDNYANAIWGVGRIICDDLERKRKAERA